MTGRTKTGNLDSPHELKSVPEVLAWAEIDSVQDQYSTSHELSPSKSQRTMYVCMYIYTHRRRANLFVKVKTFLRKPEVDKN